MALFVIGLMLLNIAYTVDLLVGQDAIRLGLMSLMAIGSANLLALVALYLIVRKNWPTAFFLRIGVSHETIAAEKRVK